MKSLRTLLAGAAALAIVAAAAPALAQEDPVDAFRDATPSCRTNPDAPIIGRASGNSDNNFRMEDEPVSFVGCFKTEAECKTWLGKAEGLIDDRQIENVCEPRNDQ